MQLNKEEVKFYVKGNTKLMMTLKPRVFLKKFSWLAAESLFSILLQRIMIEHVMKVENQSMFWAFSIAVLHYKIIYEGQEFNKWRFLKGGLVVGPLLSLMIGLR